MAAAVTVTKFYQHGLAPTFRHRRRPSLVKSYVSTEAYLHMQSIGMHRNARRYVLQRHEREHIITEMQRL